jgi:hypothetical protein
MTRKPTVTGATTVGDQFREAATASTKPTRKEPRR